MIGFHIASPKINNLLFYQIFMVCCLLCCLAVKEFYNTGTDHTFRPHNAAMRSERNPGSNFATKSLAPACLALIWFVGLLIELCSMILMS